MSVQWYLNVFVNTYKSPLKVEENPKTFSRFNITFTVTICCISQFSISPHKLRSGGAKSFQLTSRTELGLTILWKTPSKTPRVNQSWRPGGLASLVAHHCGSSVKILLGTTTSESHIKYDFHINYSSVISENDSIMQRLSPVWSQWRSWIKF